MLYVLANRECINKGERRHRGSPESSKGPTRERRGHEACLKQVRIHRSTSVLGGAGRFTLRLFCKEVGLPLASNPLSRIPLEEIKVGIVSLDQLLEIFRWSDQVVFSECKSSKETIYAYSLLVICSCTMIRSITLWSLFLSFCHIPSWAKREAEKIASLLSHLLSRIRRLAVFLLTKIHFIQKIMDESLFLFVC